MEIKINTLSENTANFGYLAEWGLCIHIEIEGRNILLDTGFSISAVNNARLMGVDLAEVDTIVLSHGHVDHTGGLSYILKGNHTVNIVAHPDIWTTKYASRSDNSMEFIGIPYSREELETKGAKFNLSREPFFITDKMLTTGEVPMTTPYEQIDEVLFVKEDNSFKPDSLADDLSIIIDAPYGLVILAGCAHRGIINIIRHAQHITNKEQVYAVIGGIHLVRSSEERIEETITDLKKTGLKKLAVSHCTGFQASARLLAEFGEAFILNNAGSRLTLP